MCAFLLPTQPASSKGRTFYCWLSLSPFIAFDDICPVPQKYFTPVGGGGMRENFHFCVITKTAIETSQGKCTRQKRSTEFSPAAPHKLIFPTESEEVFKNLCRSSAKKIKTNNKKDKDTRGTINFFGVSVSVKKTRKEKRKITCW